MAHRDIIQWKYWNTNGIGIAIVAAKGGASDVGAYIGASVAGAEFEEVAVRDARAYGAKLTKEEALGMLPGLSEIMQELGLTYRD